MTLDRSNYLDTVEGLANEIQRFSGRAGWEMQLGTWALSIGNIYLEFDPPDARIWFSRALERFRSANTEPWTTIAFIHWKTNNQQALQDEANQIVDTNLARIRAPSGLDTKKGRIARAYHEAVAGHLMLQGYADADALAREGISVMATQSGTSLLQVMGDFSAAQLAKNESDARSAIQKLRSRIEEWPSAECDFTHELYRYLSAFGRTP